MESLFGNYIKLSVDNQTLEEKVFSLVDNRNFVFAICEFLRVLDNIDNGLFERVYTAIESLDSTTVDTPAIEEMDYPSEEDSAEPREETSDQHSEEKEEFSALEKCKQRVVAVISKAIKQLTQTVEQLQAANNPKRLAGELQSLVQVCEGVCNVYDMELMV